MVYPDKNKRYVKIRKNHRNYQEEQKRIRRVRIACGAAAAVVVIAGCIIFKVPQKLTSSGKTTVETTQEKTAQKTVPADQSSKQAAPDTKKKTAEKDKQKDTKKTDKKSSKKKKEKKEEIKDTELLFTGDVLFTDTAQADFDKSGIDGVIQKDLCKRLKNADILTINNEFVYTDRGKAAPKQPLYRVPPNYIKIAKKMGVDVACLANNHALDYGPDAVSDTLFTLNGAGIKYIGIGNSLDESKKRVKIKKNKKTFGFINASHILPDQGWNSAKASPGVFSCEDPAAFIEATAEAKKDCDYLFACVHWGAQDTTDLEPYEKDVAHALIDAGADAVIGSHPHVLQTIEFYKGKPIFYSLGNFIFGDETDKSVAAQITVKKDGKMTTGIIPVCTEGAITKIAEAERTGEIYKSLSDVSPAVAISEDGMLSQK